MISIDGLLPAAEHGWLLMVELHQTRDHDWSLVGGQMVYLLALEHGAELPRATADMDVVVDVRSFQGGTGWLANWLLDRGFEQDRPSTDGISHRFSRVVPGNQGRVIVDVLAPDGLSERTDVTTIPPGRTVETPGGSQGLGRSRHVDIAITTADAARVVGQVLVPDLLGALILKAAATGIPGRANPERDWNDCALLLSILPDPISTATRVSRSDRRHLRRLTPLEDRHHPGWLNLPDDAHRRGETARQILLDD